MNASATFRHPFRHRLAALCLGVLCTFLLAGAAGADPWIHLRVESSNDETVTVNLPIKLMRAAVSMIPDDAQADISLEFDEVDLTWSELRAFWNEVKDAPEATFLTVETRDEKVAVRKEAGMVVIRTTESSDHGADVDVKLPVEVIDALLSGPEGRFDFAAAIDALVEHGPGQLMTVRDGNDRVEIWIDDNAEAD